MLHGEGRESPCGFRPALRTENSAQIRVEDPARSERLEIFLERIGTIQDVRDYPFDHQAGGPPAG